MGWDFSPPGADRLLGGGDGGGEDQYVGWWDATVESLRDPFGQNDSAGGTIWDPLDVTHGNDPLNLRGIDHTDNSASERAAEVSRQQYEDYLARFAPIEEDYINRLNDPNFVQQGVQRAGERADRASASSAGSTERDLSRYGINVTPEQRKAIERMRKLNASKTKVGAMNTARDTYGDIQTEGMQTISGYARGLAKGSTSMLGDAADSASQREANNARARAASNQQNASALMTLGWMVFSSKDYKKNIKPANKEQLHKEVMGMGLKKYDYRDDAPVQGHGMTGQIVENTNPRYTDGKMLDLSEVLHSVVASQQVLGEKVEKLEKEA